MLLHAFQIMKLSAHPLSECYIKAIIMTTKEDDLSELKCIMDSKGMYVIQHMLCIMLIYTLFGVYAYIVHILHIYIIPYIINT